MSKLNDKMYVVSNIRLKDGIVINGDELLENIPNSYENLCDVFKYLNSDNFVLPIKYKDGSIIFVNPQNLIGVAYDEVTVH